MDISSSRGIELPRANASDGIGCPLVKICGITNLSDANAANEAGADFLGFVFIERSKRYVTPAELTAWWAEVPSRVRRVALFQNASSAQVDAVLNQIDVDVLQFHGSESAAFCEQFKMPFWKSVGLPVGGSAIGESFTAVADEFAEADALLLDAVTVDASGQAISGGTGKQFDWALWPQWSSSKLILAGGLGVESIAAAVQALSPWAVDVSTGVESGPGRKDHHKLEEFCALAQGRSPHENTEVI